MLITNLTELQKYIPSSYLKSFDVIENFIANAEKKEIKPILGSLLYEELVDSYEGSDMAEKYEDLLPYVQRPLAQFAYYNAVHILDIVHTESGFGVISTQGLAPASQNRVEAFKKSILKSAYDGIEALLQYLEENKSDFPTWVASSSYSSQFEHLIPTAREFHKWVNIDESRFLYLKLLPKMGEIEEFQVKGSISEDLFDELITDLQGSADLSAAKTKLLKFLRPAIANLTMSDSLEGLATSIYAEGLMMQYSANDLNRLNVLKNTFHKTGIAYLMKARGYILANLDDFDAYVASDLYDSEITTVQPYYENDEDSHIAAFGGGIG